MPGLDRRKVTEDIAPGLPRPLLHSAGLTVIMLDGSLTIMAIRGPIGTRLMRGRHIAEWLPFLAGYTTELLGVANGHRPAFDLPRVDCHEFVDGYQGHVALHICQAQDGQGVILMLRDVAVEARHEQQRLQERNELHVTRGKLEEVTAQAQAASQAKSTFLAHVSHELKTPLAVITGNADILAGLKIEFADEVGRVDLESEIHDYANDIRESGEFLASLVTDLLDIVRAESGRFALSEEEFDLGSLAIEVVASLQRLPAARSVEIDLADNDLAVSLRADPLRLRQVLINLIANAVHASPEHGKVTVSWESNASQELQVTVRDQGPGLGTVGPQAIFEPFVGAAGGTGLGLTIARNLVELHGGRIGIESGPVGGCVAWFTLPTERWFEDKGE